MAARRETLILNREVYDSRRAEMGANGRPISVDRLARRANLSVATTMQMHRGMIAGPESRRRLALALEVPETELWIVYQGSSRAAG